MSPLDRVLAWLVAQLSVRYLGLHARVGYRCITPYRVLVRTIGRPLLRKVLDLEPLALPRPRPGDACIHLLTKGNEALFALWAVRSLLAYLDAPIPVYVHDDGSLRERHVRAIESSLPGVTIVRRSDADRLVHGHLADLPRCLAFRKTDVLSLKLFDPWIVQPTGDAIILDSDVLFFRKPIEIVQWLENPERRRTHWNVSTDIPDEPLPNSDGPRPPDGFNSGVGLVTRSSMRFERVEELLAGPAPWPTNWEAEQTLYGLLAAEAQMEPLPPTYYVADGSDASPESLVTKHYVGTNRGFFIGEGIRWLLGRSHA